LDQRGENRGFERYLEALKKGAQAVEEKLAELRQQ
jgi:hypothetical protein